MEKTNQQSERDSYKFCVDRSLVRLFGFACCFYFSSLLILLLFFMLAFERSFSLYHQAKIFRFHHLVLCASPCSLSGLI